MDYSPLPVLHAVSALRTRLCFYRMRRVWPIERRRRVIPDRPELDTDTAPQECWDGDILEDE